MDSTPNALYFGTGQPATGRPCHIDVLPPDLIIQMPETEVETVSLERLGVKRGGFDHDHLVIRWVHEGDERQVYIKDPVVIDALKTTAAWDIGRHERTSLVLHEPERNQFTLFASHFPDGNGLIRDGLHTPVEGTPAGAAFLSRKPVLVGERDLQQLPTDIARLLLAEGVKSMCCVPLLSHDRALGTLNVATTHDRMFTSEEVDLLTQVAGQFAIAVENALAYQEITELKNKLAEEKLYLEEEIRTEHRFEELVGESQALKNVLKQVEVVAPTDSTVLVLGETGTGKELVARAIHRLSGRGGRTFVKLNCAAIPTGLLESELFGHVVLDAMKSMPFRLHSMNCASWRTGRLGRSAA